MSPIKCLSNDDIPHHLQATGIGIKLINLLLTRKECRKYERIKNEILIFI